MSIDERLISLKLFNLDKKCDTNKIIEEIEYPTKTEFYEYGIYEKYSINNRILYNFICKYKTKVKVPIFNNGKIKFDSKEIERYVFGKFSIKESAINPVLELINCDNLVKSVIINEFGRGQIEKFCVAEEKYSYLYQNCLSKTAGNYVINALSKKFNINIRSDELNETEINILFDKGQIKNTSFNGKIFVEREFSFKISKDGNLLFYNNSKNPLEWEEVYRFLDQYVY